MDDETAFWVGPAQAPDTYRLVRLLGGGGEGEVWEAVLPLSDRGWRRVAVKILPGNPDPEDNDAWRRQGHLVRSLSEPGLVRVTDQFLGEVKHRGGTIPAVRDGGDRPQVGQTTESGRGTVTASPPLSSDTTMPHGVTNFRYVVMDLIEGPTLREWVDEHPQATARERLRLLAMVAAALDVMHSGAQTSTPVAHGDVKPSNIVVKADGGAVLVDLGLTRLADGPGGYGNSRPYAAPELRQDGRSSVNADRFAFYATVAHVLTGEVPLVGGNGLVDLNVLRQRLDQTPVTSGRETLIHRLLEAMSVAPHERPSPLRPWLSSLSDSLTGTATGGAVGGTAATGAAVGGATTVAPRPSPRSDPPLHGKSRTPTVLAGVLVLLLLVLVVAGLLLFGHRGGSPHPTLGPTPTPTPTTSNPTPPIPNPTSANPTPTPTTAAWTQVWGPTPLLFGDSFDLDPPSPRAGVGDTWDLTGATTIPSGNSTIDSYLTVNPFPGSDTAVAVWTGAQPPTAQECSDLASYQAVPSKAVLAKAGQTLCVRTNQDNVAIVQVESVGRRPEYANDPVTIETTTTIYASASSSYGTGTG